MLGFKIAGAALSLFSFVLAAVYFATMLTMYADVRNLLP